MPVNPLQNIIPNFSYLPVTRRSQARRTLRQLRSAPHGFALIHFCLNGAPNSPHHIWVPEPCARPGLPDTTLAKIILSTNPATTGAMWSLLHGWFHITEMDVQEYEALPSNPRHIHRKHVHINGKPLYVQVIRGKINVFLGGAAQSTVAFTAGEAQEIATGLTKQQTVLHQRFNCRFASKDATLRLGVAQHAIPLTVIEVMTLANAILGATRRVQA